MTSIDQYNLNIFKGAAFIFGCKHNIAFNPFWGRLFQPAPFFFRTEKGKKNILTLLLFHLRHADI
jgi:hypothetical protein